jgi:hypothetical protein
MRTKRRSRFPTTPALYWSLAGSFQAGLLNCGSSPDSAMSSTYWDSAEEMEIVSDVSKHSGREGDRRPASCETLLGCSGTSGLSLGFGGTFLRRG